ncbi:hypothetical protein BWR19_06235 [Halomonas sp. 1513]|nr:hypothetical protein [Halomonas sp. 1513]APX92573.1 hypothetical protein BWR19_06235 [Halomonas sp. 1513]
MLVEVTINTDDENMAELARRYWMLTDEGKFLFKVAELARDFGIKSHVIPQVVQELAFAHRTDITCTHCDTYFLLTKRTDATVPHHRLVPSVEGWICPGCVAEEVAVARDFARHKAEVSKSRALELKSMCWEADVRHQIFLLALLKHSGDEFLERVNPLSQNKLDLLASAQEVSFTVVRELLQAGLIAIDPNSPEGAYFINDDGEFRIYLEPSAWQITTFLDNESAEKGESGINGAALYVTLDRHVSSEQFLRENSEEIEKLAWEQVLDEALAYLKYALMERGLPQRFGEMTHHVLRKALEEYSLAQVYRMIWQAARNASDYLVRNRTPKQQAANTVPRSIDGYLERARANDWEVSPFRRNYDFPQSVLSRVIFNQILKTDDGGFNIPLRAIFEKVSLASTGEPG